MGTRCLTVVHTENGKELVNMYRQFDGYPDGHGAELAEFLAPFKIINGIPVGVEPSEKERFANGPECLAGQIVEHFKGKSRVGGFYLHAPKERDLGEEYVYTVTNKGGKVWLKVQECYAEQPVTIWEGFAGDFKPEAVTKTE